MARGFLGVSVLAMSGVAACSVLTNLDGLGFDAGSPDVSVGDGSPGDAPGDTTADAGADVATWTFTDDFNRADASVLGNGWIEKQPVFSIASGVVQTKSIGLDYRDEVAYRPPSENVTDVTASIEVNYGPNSGAWPQLHVRIQTSTVVLQSTLDDYLLFPASGGTANMIIARNRGGANYFTLTTFPLSSQLTSGQTYRFTLSAMGGSPVNLLGRVEQFTGNGWVSIGTSQIQDGDVNQIVTAGSVGFSEGDDYVGNYTYDNFMATGK